MKSERPQIRLALDLDGVVCDFAGGLFRSVGIPEGRLQEVTGYDFKPVLDFREAWNRVKDDEIFWLTLPVLDSYIPKCCEVFLSSRYCRRAVTEEWLHNAGLDRIPLIQVRSPEEKMAVLRRGPLNGIVEDRGETFELARKEFPSSFLVSRPWNRWVGTRNRIYRLEELDWRYPQEE